MNGTMVEYDVKSDMSVKTNSPEPSHRLRMAAATAGDNNYRNPDESDSDMSEATGEITPDFDFDSLLTFPPAAGTFDPAAVVPKRFLERKPAPPLQQIAMNISLEPDTPHISWITRRAKRMADDEAEELNPGTIAARTNKKIRRRLEPYQNKPKRKYEWRTENKNKRKTYEGNGHSGRAEDRTKALEKAITTQAEADAAAKEWSRVEKEGQLNSNRKRARDDTDEDESPVRLDGKKRRQESDDDSY
jgi:hypothetical protein